MNNPPAPTGPAISPKNSKGGMRAPLTLGIMMITGLAGAALAFPLTTKSIEGDPSSTAVLAYLVTVPFGWALGALIGAIAAKRLQDGQ